MACSTIGTSRSGVGRQSQGLSEVHYTARVLIVRDLADCKG